jgi:nuclear transport factor 2 (NTF2) superfamily protein
MESEEDILKKAYSAFNERRIDDVLMLMQTDVDWPNGWEGGYLRGHAAVKEYWTRQWKEIDPYVFPLSFKKLEDGRLQVEVRQVVKDYAGNLLQEQVVIHIYTFGDGLIQGMEIRESDS